jgi:hypothetical protein
MCCFLLFHWIETKRYFEIFRIINLLPVVQHRIAYEQPWYTRRSTLVHSCVVRSSGYSNKPIHVSTWAVSVKIIIIVCCTMLPVKQVSFYPIKCIRIRKNLFKRAHVPYLSRETIGQSSNEPPLKSMSNMIRFDIRRSLVANLGAANHFTIEHLDTPTSRQLIEQAKIFYTAVSKFNSCCWSNFHVYIVWILHWFRFISSHGFFYTVCPPAVMKICQHAHENKKVFCTNLSAPFICEFFGDKLMAAMPYVDYLFGNETVDCNRLRLCSSSTKLVRFFVYRLGSKMFC